MTEFVNSNRSEEGNDIKESEIISNLKTLQELCNNNGEYFVRDSSENGQRLYISFLAIIDQIQLLTPKVTKINRRLPEFDFDKDTPGNGYRSFFSVLNSAVLHTIELSDKVCQKRDSILFRKTSLTKDIETCSHLLASLDTCLTYLEKMLASSVPGDLFVSNLSPSELLSCCENINQYCFYGRSMGFQYTESLRNILKFIAISMAVFSEAYYSGGSLFSKATTSVLTTPKYFADPDLRARRIVDITTHAGVDFTKAFWFLSESEIMSQVPSVVASNVAISKVIHIPPEPLSINVHDKDIEVPVPSSYIGKKAIQVRLISYNVHEGMIGEALNKANAKPPTKGLLIHCHGGGFVAQSSRSHECYLRDWARELKVPILSIDYSLAPEAPFPRAHEEVTYAYCWALKNHKLLGSTGERIVAAGDSAGANLVLSTSLKCIELGIPPPKGLFLAYVPTSINFVPSPARLLCLMDPLLPFGFLMRCLKAYAVPDPTKIYPTAAMYNENSDTESFEEISVSDLVELQARISPVSEASDTYESLTSSINEEDGRGEIDLNITEIEKSEKCVSDFLEKYVLDSDTDTDGTKVPVLKQESSATSRTFDTPLQNRLYSLMSSLKGRFNNFMGTQRSSQEINLELEKEVNLSEEFSFDIPENPYLSPYCAADKVLEKLPPVKILTVELDPCLDDCVMFSKKLQSLKQDITLDILKGLPHGFLNFSLVCKEAFEGSRMCVKRINELLNLEGVPSSDGDN